MKRGMLVLMAVVGVMGIFGGLKALPYPTAGQPDWVSETNDFTMSIALTDLDLDGMLDLVTGNYKYSYNWDQSPPIWDPDEIGDFLKAYRANGTYTTFESPVPYTATRRCIDCIAAGDYDADDDPDIAVGCVVGKGKDGGVWVFDNQYPSSFQNLFSESPSYMWHPDLSFDCHCVRWFDYDCDGDLDLATLEVGGILRIFINDFTEEGIARLGFTPERVITYDLRPYLIDGGSGGEFRDDPTPYHDDYVELVGTTMEFGDLDQDGDLDLFVNGHPFPRVFENLCVGSLPGDNDHFSPSTDLWKVVPIPYGCTKGHENQFCASFGFLDRLNSVMGLAIGSMAFQSQNDVHNFDAYRNDIYKLSGENLEHCWQSEEYFLPTTDESASQLVTDIQWGSISGQDTYMDLVTASYPTYIKEENAMYGEWDQSRGREAYYEDPFEINGTPPLQAWDWRSQPGANNRTDLSTSLALGDIDGCNVLPPDTVRVHKNDTRRLLYTHSFPFKEVLSVHYYAGNNLVPPIPHWTCDLQNGWVSVNRGDDPPIELDWDYLVVEYTYSNALDLAIGNDGQEVVYFFDGLGGSSSYAPQPTNTTQGYVPPEDDFVYTQSDYIQEWPDFSNRVDLIAPDAIGTWIGDFRTQPDPAMVVETLDEYPNLGRVQVQAHWDVIEVFQGHYFWNDVDSCLNEVQKKGKKAVLFSYQTPVWTVGNSDLDSEDPKNRTSDERLHTLFTRNLVNRYRPGPSWCLGVCAQAYGWGNWGVDMYLLNNEPDVHDYMHSDVNNPHAPLPTDPYIKAIAEQIYRDYQMIKGISCGLWTNQNLDSLKFISPSWGVHSPQDYSVCDPLGNDKVAPIPYLNAVNQVVIEQLEQGQSGSRTDILAHFTDYIAQQMYCDNTGGISHDPFNQDTVPNHPELKIGIESLLWSYYTDGLALWIRPTPATADWNPVFSGEDPVEHPFFCQEWGWGYGEPIEHWNSATVAEAFSIDVFPEDTLDHRLLQYCITATTIDSAYLPVYNNLAGLLNDPAPSYSTGNGFTGSHTRFHGFDLHEVTNDPYVYHYLYERFHYYNYNCIPDSFYHFLRTEWDLQANPADIYVNADPYWTLTDLQGDYSDIIEQTPRLRCYTPEGNTFTKALTIIPGPPPTAQLSFAPGEMGPAMLIVTEQADGTSALSTAQQTVQLHTGWNLVSWNIKPPDPDWPITPLQMQEILPGPPTWLTDAGGQVYTWLSNIQHYPDPIHPEYGDWEWNLNYAYYLNFHSPPAEQPWSFTNRPLLPLGAFTFIPNPAWDSNRFDPQNLATEWFFMGYAAPGYCKLASIPNIEGTTGDPQNFDYEGPFHWLFWNQTPPYRPRGLKIIKTDDGRVYIPAEDFDNIGVLEPGKGYFLGFSDNNAYNFEGWDNWSQWRNENYVPPDQKESQQEICSRSHFQYHPYTHWSYPVIIDTVDMIQTPMVAGDEIGVFDGNNCVGSAVFQGDFPLVIACWEDDIATPDEVDGYIWNNPMTFIWYDVSANTEAEFELPPMTQAVDDSVAPSHSGFGRGFYAQRTFMEGIANLLQLPQEFKLGQNYPNPFNSSTVIPLELPQRSKVKLEVFNLKGQRVGNVYESVENAGYPKVYYDASRLASGVYFCRVTAEGLERTGKFSSVSKLVLLK